MLAGRPQLHSNLSCTKPPLVSVWAQMGAVRFTGMARGTYKVFHLLDSISGSKKILARENLNLEE